MKLVVLAILVNNIIVATPTPIIPAIDASIKKIILQLLKAFNKLTSTNMSPEIIVIAITIIIIGETIPALTAASPKIKAPTIDSVLPLELGTL